MCYFCSLKSNPSLNMSDVLKIRRGTNIKLKGEAEKILVDATPADTFAIKPPDFEGIKPKYILPPNSLIKNFQ